MARDYISAEFKSTPVGLWPSEGSVSDEVFRLAAEAGFQWAATDSGVLDRTLGRASGVEGLYRPYRWTQKGSEIRVIFRDHYLSDLIGFVYSRMDAREAAQDFLARIRENCRSILSGGRDALVPIILDGENAWEYYYQNGRPFLRELYQRISKASDMTALTVSEALAGSRRTRSITFSRGHGSARTSMCGSARKRTIRRGSGCWKPAKRSRRRKD